jgi:hypothetical protein
MLPVIWTIVLARRCRAAVENRRREQQEAREAAKAKDLANDGGWFARQALASGITCRSQVHVVRS